MKTFTKPCLQCGRIFEKHWATSIRQWYERTKYCSRLCLREAMRVLMRGNKNSLGIEQSIETRQKHRKAQSGARGSNWKGDKVGYNGIHTWLHKNFGKADCCENKGCFYPRKGSKKFLKKPYRYEWALKRGRKYKRIKF